MQAFQPKKESKGDLLIMAKRLEELLDARSSESRKRIVEDAKIILNDCLSEDVFLTELAEKAKGQKTIKTTLDDLQDQVHKNHALKISINYPNVLSKCVVTLKWHPQIHGLNVHHRKSFQTPRHLNENLYREQCHPTFCSVQYFASDFP